MVGKKTGTDIRTAQRDYQRCMRSREVSHLSHRVMRPVDNILKDDTLQ